MKFLVITRVVLGVRHIVEASSAEEAKRIVVEEENVLSDSYETVEDVVATHARELK